MPENIQNDPADMTCDAMLLQSCALYQEIDSLYELLGTKISKSSPQSLQQVAVQLGDLIEQAKTIDGKLSNTLPPSPERSEHTAALVQQREAILRTLVQRNKNIAQKAGNLKSHMRHEIGSMKTNRSAMKGYAAMGQSRKNMIHNAF